ncbi:MAG: PIG-L family deacetylase [Leptospiraceae bacterium]|nr:PIG-L family deacetylase [Leptospiraceae bacterium]MCP5492977.1 PIG-L family deacetylase [Leptospiraceae bacterium]
MTNKNRFNIACIGSHPDDVDLSMGGSVIRMIEKGHKVTLVDLSDGEPTPFGCPEVRQKESQKAASILGVERIQLDMTNRYFEDTIESRKKLAGVLRKLKCEYIFTHYEYDSHPDHVVACRLTEASRFYAKLTKSDIEGEPFYPSKIIYYFPNHIQLSIQPSFLVDTSDYLEKKIEALKCYESQFILSGKQSVLDNIVLCNKYYGFCIGMGSAEPFYLRDSLDIVRISKLFD